MNESRHESNIVLTESLHLENSVELSGTVPAEICLLLNSSSLVSLEATCGLGLSCECCTTCH